MSGVQAGTQKKEGEGEGARVTTSFDQFGEAPHEI
jgi:hypothetical protein